MPGQDKLHEQKSWHYNKKVWVKRHSMHSRCWRIPFKHVSNRHPWVTKCFFEIPPCHSQTKCFCVRSCQLARCTRNNKTRAATSRPPKTLHLATHQNPLAHTAYSISNSTPTFQRGFGLVYCHLPPAGATHKRYLQVFVKSTPTSHYTTHPKSSKRGCCTQDSSSVHIYYIPIPHILHENPRIQTKTSTAQHI